jgi:hypothetical protein
MRFGHVTIAEVERLPELVRASKGSMDAETAERAAGAVLHAA